jgi:HAD superfamily hydrolase (TIGR01509 family)
MYKSVIFDVGGVITYDLWEHVCFNPSNSKELPASLAERFDIPVSELERVGKALWIAYECRALTEGQSPADMEREYWERFLSEIPALRGKMAVDDLIDMAESFIQPIDSKGMTSLLDELKATGIHLAICSDNCEFWFPKQAENLKFYDYFEKENIVLSCDYGVTKKDPNYLMFNKVCASMHLSPDECIFVDDRIHNVVRANERGLTGIYFPSHSKQGFAYLENLLKKIHVI